MKPLRVALAQFNPTVGDIKKNTDQIIRLIEEAKKKEVDVIAFPELCITGYPPEDLLYKPHFIKENLDALESIAEHAQGIVAVVGFVDHEHDLYNALGVLNDKKVIGKYYKQHLPNYGVFDEKRYFQKGNELLLLEMDGAKIGFAICEDIWQSTNPIQPQALNGAELIININASPFSASKTQSRIEMIKTRARDHLVSIAYVNMVGGQDELVFDGASMIVNPKGEVVAQAKSFEDELLISDISLEQAFRMQLKDTRLKHLRASLADQYTIKTITTAPPRDKKSINLDVNEQLQTESETALIYKALVTGLRDYIRKNGFAKVVIGLSGGIDSALTAAVAVDALGKENVYGILMPSHFSSESSLADAEELAKNLEIEHHTIPIKEAYDQFMGSLSPLFKELPFNTAEENLQARIRGVLLMGLSNKFGWIVIATGNKSEMSVGYSTLYGDLVGGFALLKDVFKTTVYELSKYRNTLSHVIPENSITKPPSAELRPGQKDQDELPPYDILDFIIRAYVEEDYSKEDIVYMGIDEDVVNKVTRLIDMNEYKRRQAPIGVKITDKAFGKDRRMPLTNLYKK